MERPPLGDAHLIEALEACRPGRDDLSDPHLAFLRAQLADSADLAEVHARLEALDRSIGRAIHQVTVPEGLSDRILAGLTRQQTSQPLEPWDVPGCEPGGTEEPLAGPTGETRSADVGVDHPVIPGPQASPLLAVAGQGTSTTGRPRRLYTILGVCALATAASLLVAVAMRLGPKSLGVEEIQTRALTQFEQDRGAHLEGRDVRFFPPPRAYPFSRDVLAGPQCHWRLVTGFLETRQGVAYDISHPGGGEATLYVVVFRGQGLPSSPPRTPTWDTQGRSLGLWQSGNLLYVLVVKGGQRSYRAFVEPGNQPLAWRSADSLKSA